MPHRTGWFAQIAVGLAICLLFGSVGVSFYAKDHAFRSRAQRHGARVVSNEFLDRSFHPVVEFRDDQGRRVRVTSGMGFDVGGGPMYAAGDAVTVLYDPTNPAATRIESIFDRWGVPVLCSLAALLALAFFVGRPVREAAQESGREPAPA